MQVNEDEKFPEDPLEWRLNHLVKDIKGVHKLYDEIDWKCPSCGLTEQINPVHLAVTPFCVCDDCYRKGDKEEKEQQILEQIKINQQGSIPPIYMETDPDHPGLNQGSLKEILKWTDFGSGQGLWVVGDTRTGKTRSVSLLLQNLIKRGKEVRSFYHGSFADELLEVIRSEKSFRAWKSKVIHSPILFIDDLFNSKMTDRTEATLFDVFDARISWKRPTLVTTQYTARESRGFFHSDQRLRAFFARINETFKVVTIKKDNQTKLNISR